MSKVRNPNSTPNDSFAALRTGDESFGSDELFICLYCGLVSGARNDVISFPDGGHRLFTWTSPLQATRGRHLPLRSIRLPPTPAGLSRQSEWGIGKSTGAARWLLPATWAKSWRTAPLVGSGGSPDAAPTASPDQIRRYDSRCRGQDVSCRPPYQFTPRAARQQKHPQTEPGASSYLCTYPARAAVRKLNAAKGAHRGTAREQKKWGSGGDTDTIRASSLSSCFFVVFFFCVKNSRQ